MKTVQLPADFHACERGNVMLSNDDNYISWLTIGPDQRLEFSFCPDNYPKLNVKLVEMTNEQLCDYIQSKLVGWTSHKLNLGEHEVATNADGIVLNRPES